MLLLLLLLFVWVAHGHFVCRASANDLCGIINAER